MQVPGRSAVLVAVLALVSLLLAGCGGGSEGSGSSAADTGTTTSSSTTPTTSPSTSPEDPLEAQVDDALAGLDRRAQIAQLFVIGVRLDDLDAGDALVDDGVGGVFLAGRSEAPVEDIAAVTGRWQAAAPGPGVWVAVDQEGGAVQTLKGSGFDRLPSARDQGALPADQLAALAEGLGASLAAAGVNLDLAPVVDVVPPGTEARQRPDRRLRPRVRRHTRGGHRGGRDDRRRALRRRRHRDLQALPGPGPGDRQHRRHGRRPRHRHDGGRPAADRVLDPGRLPRRALRDGVVGDLRPDRRLRRRRCSPPSS